MNHPEPSAAKPLEEQAAIARNRLLASARLFMGSLVFLGFAVGAFGDLFLAVVITFAGLFGYRGLKVGAIHSLFALVSVLCVYAWSVPLGKWLAGITRVAFDVPLAPHRYICILLAAAMFIGLGQITGRLSSMRHARRCGRHARKAPLAGMVLGLCEGTTVAVTILVALVAIEPAVRMGLAIKMNQVPWARSAYGHLLQFRHKRDQTLIARALSRAYEEEREVLEMGTFLAVLSKYPGAVKAVDEAEEVHDLLRKEPVFKSVRRQIELDRDLKRAVKEGDLAAILNSPTVIRILDDRELADALKAHREELIAAMLTAIPGQYRVRAAEEFAYLSGLPPKALAAGVRRSLDQIRLESGERGNPQLDELIKSLELEISADLERELNEAADAGESSAVRKRY